MKEEVKDWWSGATWKDKHRMARLLIPTKLLEHMKQWWNHDDEAMYKALWKSQKRLYRVKQKIMDILSTKISTKVQVDPSTRKPGCWSWRQFTR
eukprot:TRINITY_DN86222_c0_g1_i1.p1 TRINITY_DN86222_c0_g1~~TRINITY_DN86222_c0_g1_i1.p1  ORF type:complete len:102 (-),score=10.89 TRINITY_DN86222_c0_g1_i1:22-303(-)